MDLQRNNQKFRRITRYFTKPFEKTILARNKELTPWMLCMIAALSIALNAEQCTNKNGLATLRDAPYGELSPTAHNWPPPKVALTDSPVLGSDPTAQPTPTLPESFFNTQGVPKRPLHRRRGSEPNVLTRPRSLTRASHQRRLSLPGNADQQPQAATTPPFLAELGRSKAPTVAAAVQEPEAVQNVPVEKPVAEPTVPDADAVAAVQEPEAVQTVPVEKPAAEPTVPDAVAAVQAPKAAQNVPAEKPVAEPTVPDAATAVQALEAPAEQPVVEAADPVAVEGEEEHKEAEEPEAVPSAEAEQKLKDSQTQQKRRQTQSKKVTLTWTAQTQGRGGIYQFKDDRGLPLPGLSMKLYSSSSNRSRENEDVGTLKTGPLQNMGPSDLRAPECKAGSQDVSAVKVPRPSHVAVVFTQEGQNGSFKVKYNRAKKALDQQGLTLFLGTCEDLTQKPIKKKITILDGEVEYEVILPISPTTW